MRTTAERVIRPKRHPVFRNVLHLKPAWWIWPWEAPSASHPVLPTIMAVVEQQLLHARSVWQGVLDLKSKNQQQEMRIKMLSKQGQAACECCT